MRADVVIGYRLYKPTPASLRARFHDAMRKVSLDSRSPQSADRSRREFLNHQHVGLVVGDGGDRFGIRAAVQAC